MSGLKPNVISVGVAIIGGGPSGLRAASELAERIPGGVVVFEREKEAGGIPRHSDHPGYGIRDLGKFITGPKYAKILRDAAAAAGAEIRTNATVTDWTGPRSFLVTTPEGRSEVQAEVVILATGARERPRPARMIPGDRSQGILTTGLLQNLVHIKHREVGKRAVIVGAELVSWSAALTLKHSGCKTVMMTTEYPQADSYAAFSILGRVYFGTRVATRTRVTRVIGKPRVEAVEIQNIDTGVRSTVACDTVIFTGDWIPDNELARSAGMELNAGTKGPRVDSEFRTTVPGVFAIGNMLHPVDTADIAALDGLAVADAVFKHLRGQRPNVHSVELNAEAPLRWVSPGYLRRGDNSPARNRLLAWSDRLIFFPKVTVTQRGKIIGSKRLLWPAAPGRVFRVPSGILREINWSQGEVTLGVQ